MLLEALIGILIFSIGILALIAMQSVAVSQVRDAQFRSEAAVLADRMMGNLVLIQSSVPTLSATPTITQWKTEVTNTLPSGVGRVTLVASALGSTVTTATITITWRVPGASTTSNHTTIGTLGY